MKITEHIKNAKGKTLFSFELLPPVKGKSIEAIYNAIDPLMEFKPPFIDVTYHREDYIYKQHETGLLEKISYRKRPGTVAICAAIINKYKVDAVPHLICGGFTKEETENALIDLQFLGIDNVLVLRGDARHADSSFIPTPGGHAYATDLLAQVMDRIMANICTKIMMRLKQIFASALPDTQKNILKHQTLKPISNTLKRR